MILDKRVERMNNWNREFFEHNKFLALTFDDVSLVPNSSDVLPDQISLETRLTQEIRLNMPFISANMDSVTEARMAIEMALLGGIGILWKSRNPDDQVAWLKTVKHYMNARINHPITVLASQTLAEAKGILAEHSHFSTLVVLDENSKVVGLLTDDRTQFDRDPNIKVRELMVPSPVTTTLDLDLQQAYDFMWERKLPKVILVDKEGKLKGMYCWKDVRTLVEKREQYTLDERGRLRVGADIGILDFERAERALKEGCDVLVVSPAHGYSKNAMLTIEDIAKLAKDIPETVAELRRSFAGYKFQIIGGNVAWDDGAEALCKAGANAVKVGLGAGSICTTRLVAGVGVPQMTAVYKAWTAASKHGVPIIADGGFRQGGDLTKAAVAGAETFMFGALLAATDESPGEMRIIDGKQMVLYRGMGSDSAMRDSRGAMERYGHSLAAVKSGKTTAEGVEGAVLYLGSARKVIGKLAGGLQSGLGYIGAKALSEAQDRGRLVQVTNAGLIEARPHDIQVLSDTGYSTTKGSGS